MNMLGKILSILMMSVMCTGVSEANVVGEFVQDVKDLTWEEGRIRIEGQGWAGTRSGRRSRTGDWSVTATVEKEFKLKHRLTVGLRAIPLFYYEEEETDEKIWGAGVGASFRWYTQEAMDGWYVEYSESLVGHDEKFRGNSGTFNFMSEVAWGYEFDNNWHVAAKWRHLSNGGLASSNAGINGLGISIGYSF